MAGGSISHPQAPPRLFLFNLLRTPPQRRHDGQGTLAAEVITGQVISSLGSHTRLRKPFLGPRQRAHLCHRSLRRLRQCCPKDKTRKWRARGMRNKENRGMPTREHTCISTCLGHRCLGHAAECGGAGRKGRGWQDGRDTRGHGARNVPRRWQGGFRV